MAGSTGNEMNIQEMLKLPHNVLSDLKSTINITIIMA